MLPQAWKTTAAIFLSILAIFGGSGRAQVFDLETDRIQIAELRGLWHFHPGDDPDGKLGWADPEFNDSSWILLHSYEPWSVQGFGGYEGMAWYRFKMTLSPQTGSLAVYMPYFYSSYQVYAGGRLVFQRGGMPPHPWWVYGANRPVFTIPVDVISSGKPLQMAIRVWYRSTFSDFFGGGPNLPIYIGNTARLTRYRDLVQNDEFSGLQAANILLFINLFVGIAALAFFTLNRSDREYLWFGGFEVSNAIVAAMVSYFYWHVHSAKLGVLLLDLFGSAGLVMFTLFLFKLLRQRQSLLFWLAVLSVILSFSIEFPFQLEWISESTSLIVNLLCIAPYYVAVITTIVGAARRGNHDAALLVFPVALDQTAGFVGGLISAIQVTRHSELAGWFNWFWGLSTRPFLVSVPNVLDAVMQLSILAILVLRFARTRRDEERLRTEFESARTVQQVLVPDEVPSIPGFAIQCVYRPAGQVGGDFFQVIPTATGALVVIGDVSGKGMPAAMAVSLLVGTVRTLAHFTQSPAAILAAMNQRMLSRSKGGFTTCLAVRIESSGTVTGANAGHLCPYVNGTEITLDNGMPLGLVGDAAYTESSFELRPQQQLTLLTDGVVEARGKTKELFGFKRAASIANESAENIAQAAVTFGQEDDITVLTIRREMLASELQMQFAVPLPSESLA
jgi:hypothetical protein